MNWRGSRTPSLTLLNGRSMSDFWRSGEGTLTSGCVPGLRLYGVKDDQTRVSGATPKAP